MMIRQVAMLTLIGAVCVAAPERVRAQNPLEMVSDPGDRAVMAEAAAVMAEPEPDLAKLDLILAKLSRPTPLRGMVQTARAGALTRLDRKAEALRAIEEGLTLLPQHPGPRLIAVAIMTFAGAPQRAADLWLGVSISHVDLAKQMPPYIISALVGRLRDLGDVVRADRLSARMGEVGYATLLAPSRSSSALAGARADIAAGRIDAATDAVSRIGNPDDLLNLYVDRRTQALWPRIEQWAEPTLQGQAKRHLEDLRREWEQARDHETATNYARALAGRRQYAAVVTLFLPLLQRDDLTAEVEGVEFLTTVVVRSLTMLGREPEAMTLLTRIASLYTAKERAAQALNFRGSQITHAFESGRWTDTVTLATTFLDEAGKLGPAVNSSATLAVLAIRGCALWKADRRDEAATDMAAVLVMQAVQPGPAMRVHQCREDTAGARDLIIASLAREDQRSWALRWVQPQSPAPGMSAVNRIEYAASEALRRDPQIIAAAEKVGRILPSPIGETLPPDFDPFAAQIVAPTPDAI